MQREGVHYYITYSSVLPTYSTFLRPLIYYISYTVCREGLDRMRMTKLPALHKIVTFFPVRQNPSQAMEPAPLPPFSGIFADVPCLSMCFRKVSTLVTMSTGVWC
jgi:hypothetical protein